MTPTPTLPGQLDLLDLLAPPIPADGCQCPACGAHYRNRRFREVYHGPIYHWETRPDGGLVCGAMYATRWHVYSCLVHGPHRADRAPMTWTPKATQDTIHRAFRLWGTAAKTFTPAEHWPTDQQIEELRAECTRPFGEDDPCTTP